MPANKIIVVNARFLIKDKLEGIGYFTQETMKRIVAANPDYTFHFLFDRAYDASFITASNIVPVVLFPPARHPFLWYCWFQWRVKRYLNKVKPALFLSPDGFLPLHVNTPTLAVQHDIAFVHFPEGINRWTNAYYQYFVPKFLQQATRIATVSVYSKNDMIKQYAIPPEKIDVVYSAAKPDFHPTTDEKIQQEIRQQYAEGEEYFVYVGAVHPRKNVLSLLQAFELYKKQSNAATKLLIAGALGWQNKSLSAYYEGMVYREDVHFLGRIELSKMVEIIGSSIGLVYVSLFEGFGVPPLEGMACGVPVIASNVTSLPEVCGDAAILVPPLAIADIASAMQLLSEDKKYAATLIAKGEIQAQKFNWDNTAALLWNAALNAMKE